MYSIVRAFATGAQNLCEWVKVLAKTRKSSARGLLRMHVLRRTVRMCGEYPFLTWRPFDLLKNDFKEPK